MSEHQIQPQPDPEPPSNLPDQPLFAYPSHDQLEHARAVFSTLTDTQLRAVAAVVAYEVAREIAGALLAPVSLVSQSNVSEPEPSLNETVVGTNQETEVVQPDQPDETDSERWLQTREKISDASTPEEAERVAPTSDEE